MITEFAGLGLPSKEALGIAKEPQKTKDDAMAFETTIKSAMDSKASKSPEPVRDRSLQNENKPAMNSVQKNQSENRSEKPSPMKNDSKSDKKIDQEDQVQIRGMKAQLNPKQKAMLKFMDSMESELGIPPQRIVEAMAQLSEQELALSPEDTAQTIISQLQLDPEDQQRAEEMYMAMLQDISMLQPKSLVVPPMLAEVQAQSVTYPTSKYGAEIATSASPVNASAVNQPSNPLLSDKERRMALNQNLEKLNNKFFMNSEIVSPEAPALTQESLAPMDSARPDFASEFADGDGLNITDVNALKANPAIPMKDVPTKEIPMQGMSMTQASPEQQQQLMKSLAALSAAAAALGKEIKEDPANQQALSLQKDTHGAAIMGEDNPWLKEFSKNQEQSSQMGQGEGQFTPQSHLAHAVNPTAIPAAGKETAQFFVPPEASASAAAAASLQQQAPADLKESNIQSILNQTQYMIKKGGGEARVQMTPEGLGKVDLKVTLNDGKVNVEMSTESKEAKKLLESNISDLKSTLSSQKIHVDSVRVDVNTSLSSDSRNNNSNGSSENQQGHKQQFDFNRGNDNREQARQFMQNFRDENFARRDQGYEIPSVKSYRSPYDRPDLLNPDRSDVSAGYGSSSKSKRYASQGKGSGLDLVA